MPHTKVMSERCVCGCALALLQVITFVALLGFNKVLSPDVVETEDSHKQLEVHHIGLLCKQQRWRKKWVERLFEVKNGCLSYKYPMVHPKHETKEHAGEAAHFSLHLP